MRLCHKLFKASAGSMRAWQVDAPNAPLSLRTIDVPQILSPNDVLIRVKACSVNPLDVRFTEGYGETMLSKWKQLAHCSLDARRYPLTPGRDCAGVVEAVGAAVNNLASGDEVMAIVPSYEQGTHAEFVVTSSKFCISKPKNLDFVEAASLPYVANTAWSALVSVAQMKPRGNNENTRVLVHGGSGGVGSIAIQLLKGWGVPKIVATCSKANFEFVRSLGAIPVDYGSADATDELIAQGPFEVVFDCVDSTLARWSDEVMGVWRNCVHVSIVSPMLRDTDRYGLLSGLLSTAAKYTDRSTQSALKGRFFSYAYCIPSADCMKQLHSFAESGQVKPIVEKVFSFEELPAAYEKVSQLHGRGKTVIKL